MAQKEMDRRSFLKGLGLGAAGVAMAGMLPVMPALADDPLQLTMFFPVNVGGSAAQLIENMTAEFNAQNPDIQVQPVYTGNYDDTVTAIQSSIGTAPRER